MLGRLNHVAIAVPDIKQAADTYRATFGMGAKVSGEVAQPDHGVTTVFIDLGNTKIELLEPLGENSPIANFLKKNPSGGIHHVCYEVEDIHSACARMREMGATITGTGEPRIGAHGKPVVFMHPKDFNGTLIELEQV
ncbi:MAG TPA: methylmalonyl-CoA epimerase [Alphaproteobacteria bacterium]|nr:methylmalonyl-CoA epimerase [Alphaproteobacteria bacterium]HAJ46575.1 methylmalonyl-CoA epimerase [Alphaproteobacteria bacterium]